MELFMQLAIGLIGLLILCILIRPFVLGAFGLNSQKYEPDMSHQVPTVSLFLLDLHYKL
jgi:hypothetical protein